MSAATSGPESCELARAAAIGLPAAEPPGAPLDKAADPGSFVTRVAAAEAGGGGTAPGGVPARLARLGIPTQRCRPLRGESSGAQRNVKPQESKPRHNHNTNKHSSTTHKQPAQRTHERPCETTKVNAVISLAAAAAARRRECAGVSGFGMGLRRG